ncbi:hypothetical protein J4772_04220 [Cohnella sp. LGH]|uniref:hypothetical protein n=1 Tax=Cohnella sp. LGH TaxID=1619153 RepID=UPI001ADB268D|nr:hypothetical protein [Cohnella sp. LGH]QTH43648.1 hypothetical protein J4772_04220 [Cohnella sp. LGH]
MAVTLFLAESIDECREDSEYVHFDDEIHHIIYIERNKLPVNSEILYSLDPYGIELFDMDKIKQLKNVTSQLIQHNEGDERIVTFLCNLTKLCDIGIKQNKRILSLGD